MCTFRLTVSLVALTFFACDTPPSSAPGDVSADTTAEATVAVDTTTAEVRNDGGQGCDLPLSQGLSEPCCLALGVDACGAGLFCAAFDGRTQATCYPERSRADQAECLADVQCTSGACNATVSRCQSGGLAACTAAIGCAPTPDGQRYLCAPGSHTCQPTSGQPGGLCTGAGDCSSGYCVAGKCTSGYPGAACGAPGDCESNICVHGQCNTGHTGADCAQATDCGSEAPYCANGGCWSGGLGMPCESPQQCGSEAPLCSDGYCSAGAVLGEACVVSSDCAQDKSPLGHLQAVLCDGTKKVCVLAAGGKCTRLWDGEECASGATCQPDHTHPGSCSEGGGACTGNFCDACHGSNCSTSFNCIEGLSCQ